MNATLNIYLDCESDEPVKTYVCKRMTYGTAKKLQRLSDKAKNETSEEQEKTTIELLRTIFPNFEDEELNYIDVNEYMQFVKDIGNETQSILEVARKN